MHPTGTFEAEVIEHAITESSKGTPQVAVKFETSEGEITGWFALTDKAAEYTIQKLRAMGFQGDDLQAVNDGRCMVGNQCNLVIEHEKYKDKNNNDKIGARIKFVNPLGVTGGADLTPSDGAAANARRFNALLTRAPKQAVHTKADALKPSQSEPIDDDDIPF
jgi:hypothetical protein